MRGEPPVIYGGGEQTRDFIDVSDIVEANMSALERTGVPSDPINIGTGIATSIKELANILIDITGRRDLKPAFDQPRTGDIKHSCAKISKARRVLGYEPKVPLREGLVKLLDAYGGALLDTGCHAIDLMLWLLNDQATVKYVFLGYKFRLSLEDMAILSIQFNKGTKAVLMTGWFTTTPKQRIAFYGTAGSKVTEEIVSKIDIKKAASEVMKNLVSKLLGKEIKPYPLSEGSRAYYAELEHFIDCVREDKEPLVTGDDGLKCAKLIDEAYRFWRSANPLNKENDRQ